MRPGAFRLPPGDAGTIPPIDPLHPNEDDEAGDAVVGESDLCDESEVGEMQSACTGERGRGEDGSANGDRTAGEAPLVGVDLALK